MKKARNFWRDLPQGGSRYGSVLTRLFLLLCLLVTTQAGWAAINNTTVTKGSQKFIDVATTAASSGDEVTVSNQYIAYTVSELVSSSIKNVWYTQQSSGAGSSNTDAVSITGYRATCNKYTPFKSSNKQTFYVTKCVSFAILYDPRGSERYATITATNFDDPTDTKTITNSGTVSSGTKYNVELKGLDASKYYKIELVTNNSSADSRLYQVRLEASSGPTAPTFSPVSGTTVSGSQTITIDGPSGSTIYYAWATSAQDAAAIYNSGSGSHGNADAGKATTTVESGKTLYAIARKNDTNSTVASASYTIDDAAPTLSSSNPENNATDVATSGNIILTFSENVTIKDASKFTIDKGATLNTASATNKVVTIPYTGLANSTTYTITIGEGAVKDAVGNENAEITYTFTTAAAATKPATPVLSPTGGTYSDDVTVTISKGNSSDDVKLYYRVDNSEYKEYPNGTWTEIANDGTVTLDTKTKTKYLSVYAVSNADNTKISDRAEGHYVHQTQTNLTGAWSANPTFDNGASATIPTFSVTGGSATSPTDYTVAYSLKTDGGNVTVDPSNGITEINTSVPGTSVVTATITVVNTTDYKATTTAYDCTITVNDPATVSAITKADTENGSFTVKVGGSEVTEATSGATVTVTTTPSVGYEVDAVTLSPSGTVTKASTNNYTFTMPASAVTVTVTFKDATVSGLTPVTSYTWAVDQNAWSSYTTSSEIKANTIVDNIEIIANNSHSVKFGSSAKQFTEEDETKTTYTKFWKLGSPGSEYRLLHFKVAGRCKISAYVNQGSTRTVEIRKGSYNGTVIAETGINSNTPTIVSGEYEDDTPADIYVYSKANELGVYAIKVETLAAEVSAPTITQNDGDTYTGTASSKSITIATTAGSGNTYYVLGTAAATSGAAIYDNGSKHEATGSAETIDLSSFATTESDVVVSAVTKVGNNYSDIVTATYTYNGIRHFNVAAANKTLQVGGRDNVDPYITYRDGTRFEIGDDDNHELSDYFTFTYERTTGADADVLVDPATGVINIPSTATKDHTATIKITATPTVLGQTLFNSGSQTGTMTVTVKEKEEGLKMWFYWDPEFTQPVTTSAGAEWQLGDGGSRTVFQNTYENGRMIYVKPEPGYEIWVATANSSTAQDGSLSTPTASINKYSNTNYSTTHGIPLYISGMSNGQERTFVIGMKAYKAGTTEGVGNPVSARFRIVQTEAGQAKRPAAPTFSPTKSEAGTLSTAQTVAAVGATGSYVFSKFGSKDLGLGYFINYLKGTQAGREQVATFSTEVGGRDIKALQITGSGNEYYISNYGSEDGYPYNLAAKLLVTPATYYVNVGDAFTTPALTKITTDQEEEPHASDYSSPTLTGYFYNKQKAEANAAPYQGLKFEEPAGTSLLSYSIQNFNGAEASIDPSTGVVAIGNKSGYAIVSVNYAGGEKYTIETEKVGKKSTTTSPMTATYRINIVDPNEYLPIINPTSRKFANSLDVTISVPDEDHYVKYVIANGEEVKTAEVVKAAGETINKNSRVTVTVGENINVGDKVSVYAIAYDDNGVTSTVVKETYTKATPLQKPTLSPDGVTKPYEYTESELAVAAVAYNAGAIIYYTTDGSDPTKSGAKTYDGASKILVEKEDGTTIIKAAAYLDGIYSDVVTGTYVPTDDLAQPWFLVNGTQVTGSEKHISTTDDITISNGREGNGSVYYYTLDGTAPSVNEGEPYTAGFHIYKTVTAKAIATENGLISPATTVTFIIDDEGDTKKSLWEAIDETTPEGTMDANDRKVYVTKHTNTKGTSSYIYVENLAATFGGFDNNDWNKTSIGENTQGAAMDGVGKYSIRNIMDVKEETDRDYDPTNMLIGTVHGRTHALPSQGAYVKFEPEKDGVLTIWALQQGGLHYSADGDFCSRFIRFRPVFMVDETGKSIAATKAESTACLSKNWSDVESDNWLPRNSGSQNGDKNLYYSDEQNDAIYGMYTTWMSNNSISDGGNIKPFEAPASIYPTLFTTGSNNASDYNDVHGYVMPSGGNVKYTFNVQAGKTYFFFGFRTKLGIRGFKFEPSTTDLGETVTLPQTTDATTFISTNNGQTKNVKLVRKVKKNIWTTFCLPFSVSETQLENTFGAGTQVMQFVKVDGYTMNVFKHYHHMIVAGTPILVCPTNDDMTEFTFNGVHIENVTPEEICDSEDDTYKFVGGYTPMTVNNGSYYIGNDGLWHKLNNTKGSSTLNGSRAYLKLKEGSNAKTLTLNITSFDGEEDYTTTGIANIESDGIDLDGVNDSTNKYDDNIYNIQGQLVRKHAKNFNGLKKGVYIINGKKVVIND